MIILIIKEIALPLINPEKIVYIIIKKDRKLIPIHEQLAKRIESNNCIEHLWMQLVSKKGFVCSIRLISRPLARRDILRILSHQASASEEAIASIFFLR